MSWGEGGSSKLSDAIAEVAAAIAPMETEWDQAKLEKKLYEYFRKGAKGMEFRGALPKLVNEYADNVMGTVFSALGDREWLNSGQADFLLCLDAGVKESFPPRIVGRMQQAEFEQLVLGAYDRAFDEQRFCPILSEAVPQVVSGPKIKKKVWNSVDTGRKDAVATGTVDVDEFTTQWINASVGHLAQATQGSPKDTMEPELCTQLFTVLLEGNGLPLSLMMEGAVAPVHLVEEAVTAAYEQHTVSEEDWAAAGPAAKKRKGGGGGGSFSLW